MSGNPETTPLVTSFDNSSGNRATSEFHISTGNGNDNGTPNRPRNALHSSFTPKNWIPGPCDVETVPVDGTAARGRKKNCAAHSVAAAAVHTRSLRRRLFLTLTEPETSFASALFLAVLVVTIALMNIVMILQTMERWQYTPTDCRWCGETVAYDVLGDDDSSGVHSARKVACLCPPAPLPWTVTVVKYLVYFFTVEWFLRLCTFDPPATQRATTVGGIAYQWLRFLTSSTTILDALAIFPYYVENMANARGLMSLRLLRLFRVFQLVRLGQYNEAFTTLTAVLYRSLQYLKLLLGALFFGAAFFGSMIYWVEKGEWKYFAGTNSYQFVRFNQYGVEEISPFTSIPAAFWWFAVTATTVGYGDTFPTSTLGKWIAAVAMLMGVLVIALPVSVFSDLWSKELRKTGVLTALDDDDEKKLESNVDSAQSRSSLYNSLEELPPSSRWTNNERQEIQIGLVRDSTRDMSDDLLAFNSDQIVVSKDDLTDLLAHVQTMNESQQQIRAILRKYKLA